MKKVILKIGGMSCSACQNRVEKYLNKQDGVSASVNLVMGQALIKYDENKVTIKDLERFVSLSGYESLGIYNEKEENEKDNSKIFLILLAILILLIMYISMSHMLKIPMISFLDMHMYPINYSVVLLILTIPFIIFGFDIIKSGITKLFDKSPNMDTLVTVGVLSSFIYSLVNLVLIILGNSSLVSHLYFESVCMIIYFVKLGRFIDKNSKNKAKEAIKELVVITPDVALIKDDGEVKEITIDEVKKGNILVCKPGMKVAVDGTIVYGSSHFDEKFITGESMHPRKKVNDNVIAGSINIDGYIEYKALKIGPESTISEIVRLVVEAVNTKAPISKIADKVSSYFVPLIMLIAFTTFVIYMILGKSFDESIISFVTVLVVACPCALGLATPLAMVVSVGKSAKDGILIKSNEILEYAKDIDTIVFDKTGTLTYGNLSISKIYNYSDYTDKEILNIVSSLENNSTHPISTAFKKYYDKNIIVKNFNTLEGIGIYGDIVKDTYYVGNNKLLMYLHLNDKYKSDEDELSKNGNSLVYVIKNKKVVALIGVKDIVRDKAKDTITKLKNMNKNVIMLSGDNVNTASIIAKEIGIQNVIANVMPKDKEKVIKDLKKEHKVMMVGDGINDAPALASSDIGISINSGTDIAANSSDIILMNDNLLKLIEIFKISKNTVKIIKQNLFWAFIYNILMIPIAIGLFKPLGLTINPMVASISMTISSLTVVFNSLRLRK